MSKLSLGAIVAGVAWAWACTSTPGPEFPDASSFCTGLAQAECTESTNCETPSATCVTERTGICNSTATTATAHGRTYQSGNAPDCVNLAKTTYAASNAKITSDQLSALKTSCDKVFAGNVADGVACTADADCANSEICDSRVSVCAKPVSVATAGFCGEPGQVCPANSYCNGTSTTSKCTASPTLGGQCTTAIPCADSFRCILGACAARATVGQPCASDGDCDPTAPLCNMYDPPARCSTGQIFSPAETNLCQDFGGGSAVPFVPGTPVVVVQDAGPGDSGGDSAPSTSLDGATD